MKNKMPKQGIAFSNNYAAAFIALFFLSLSFNSFSQIHQPPTLWGKAEDRLDVRKALQGPTGNGDPTSTNKTAVKRFAIYLDSTNFRLWIWNPKTDLWDTLHIGATGGGGGTGWLLPGNAGTTAGTDFLGTTDSVDLVVKTKSVEQLRFLASGGVNIPVISGTGTGVIYRDGKRFIHNYPNYANQNLFIGANSGNFTMSSFPFGSRNTAFGDSTLYANTTGYGNVAMGIYALAANTTGFENIAIGRSSLINNTTGNRNTAVGAITLNLNTIGHGNVAIGTSAGQFGTTAQRNTLVGVRAMQNASSGFANVAVGFDALYGTTYGDHNVAVGLDALYFSDGTHNTALGDSTFWGLYGLGIKGLGYKNIALGSRAGYHLGDTYPNFASIYDTAVIFLGANASRDSSIPYTTSLQNMIVVGYNSRGTASNQVTLGNDDITSTLLKGAVKFNNAFTFPTTDGTSGQQLQTNGSGVVTWQTPSGGGGVTTMAAIGSSPNANGATISGSNLTLQPADGTYGGILTAGSQTISGNKTVLGIVAGNGINVAPDYPGTPVLHWYNPNNSSYSNWTMQTLVNGAGIGIYNYDYGAFRMFLGPDGSFKLGGDSYSAGTIQANSSGNVTIPSTLSLGDVLKLKAYTVGTLPTGAVGDVAYVTDALTPAFGVTLVGGGAVKTIAFFDGTNWTAH